MDSPIIEGIKRLLGVVWIGLGLFILYESLISSDSLIGIVDKITSSNQADIIFGWILLVVLLPIVCGSLFLFGYLSLSGEYAKD